MEFNLGNAQKEETMKLQEALARCNRITPKKSSMPVLMNVLIEPTEAGVCITATDLEMFYQVDVEGVTANDTFMAPLRQLRDIIGKKDVKEITWGPGNVITVGAAKFFGLPKEEFPPFPLKEVNLEDYREVKLNNLPWVSVAQSTDEIRHTLNGVYLDTKAGNMVATDGHRLHMTQIDPVEDVKPVIIPRPAVAFLSSIKAGSVWLPKICKKCSGSGKKDNNAPDNGDGCNVCKTCKGAGTATGKAILPIFISDDEVFTSRPVDGSFPDYPQVLPQKKNINFQLKTTKEALKAAIIQTDGIRPQKSNGIKFTLNGACHLSTSNPEVGEIDVEFKGKFKNLLKPLDNPCEGCKDKKVAFCSTRMECAEYGAYNSGGGEHAHPCEGCLKKQGDCDKVASGCGSWRRYCLSIQGEFNIGVNARYLSEGLFGEDIIWEFGDEFGPTKLTFGGGEAAVIMPTRL